MNKMFTRRDALKLGLLTGGALLLPLGLQQRGSAASPKTTAFQLPLKIPPVLTPVNRDATTDYYVVTMKQAQIEILPGLKTTIWGYDGLFPGPTIKGRVGRKTWIRQVNTLPNPMVAHNHGMASEAQHDGHPDDIIATNSFRDYIYPNNRASTMRYHDHAMHDTALHVWKGLTGTYIIQDDIEDSLPLPKGAYDIPLMIQDRQFASDGSLVYNDNRAHNGVKGDIILVNGTPWPRFEVANRKYRFRILNSSNARAYRLTLSSGEPLIVIGTDGGLISKPAYTSDMRIGMAERYEVIIDFSKYKIGTKVILKNLFGETSALQQIMRFDVVRAESDNSSIPATLRTVAPIPTSSSVRTRDFLFRRGAGGAWVINGELWDSNRVDAFPKLGDTEIWTLRNPSNGWFHPIHLHLVDFQILDRNGQPPFPYEVGWKDVAYVGETETVRIITKFGPHKGKFVMHCHNLEHEDHMMMTQFQVI